MSARRVGQAHVIPEAFSSPPPTVVFSLPFYSMNKQRTAGNSQTQMFSVPPSTGKFYVGKISDSCFRRNLVSCGYGRDQNKLWLTDLNPKPTPA